MKVPNPVRMVRRLPFPFRAAPVPRGVEPPERSSGRGADFDTEWARRYPARLARLAILEGVIRPTAKVLADPTRRGTDRLDDLEGPAVFVANHHSHLDTPLMLTSIPEPWRHRIVVAAAADYFFPTKVSGAAAALALNAIPIERTKVNRRSAALAEELLDEGWSLLIFPEGGRSPDGWGQPFRGGAAYIALRAGLPVAPVHVAGTGRILGKGMNRPRPGRTRITFGHPIHPTEDDDARSLGPRIEQAVAALADESTTDWYAARRNAHAGTTPPLTGPDAPTWRRAWALGDPKRTRKRRRWPDLG
ncbi:MAG: lysophospholipid acyltransferase family protein [Actinomycetota bacterium]